MGAKDLDEPSDVILGGCDYDKFAFDKKTQQIRLRNTDFCINAEGGIGFDAPLIVWQCTTEKGKVPENERFHYDAHRGVIFSLKDPNLIFNIKGGNISVGTPAVLYPIVFNETNDTDDE